MYAKALSLLLAAAFASPIAVHADDAVPAATPSHPNIIVILSDDVGYGDLGDSVVGGFMDTLKKLNLAKNTIVIFSSDNGPIVNDGYQDGSFKNLNGHKPAGPYRGGKYQIYEAGTRVPFIVSWPGTIPPGVSAALVNHVDFFASLTDLAGVADAAKARPDSQDVLPALLGKSPTARTTMVEQSITRLALREGPWQFISAGADAKQKKIEDGDKSHGPVAGAEQQLYNLETDPGEKQNVAAKNPDVVAKMSAELNAIVGGDAPPAAAAK